MTTVYIVIPTFKKYSDIQRQLNDITVKMPDSCFVLGTCFPGSAAENRNIAHSAASCSDIIVSLDDDITGFYEGWLSDMIQPLLEDSSIRFASARFLKPDGKSLGFMMTSKNDMRREYEEVPRCPTSAYAYRKDDFDALKGFWNETSQPFDTRFKGGGWEDNAICHDLKKKFPDTKIIINNKCRLIHINEMKNQLGNIFKENKEYFFASGRSEK